MLIIDLTYKKPLSDIEDNLDDHREFLDKYYSAGVFLASGPKTPRTGGIIVALADKSNINDILREDPFYIKDIADYTITEFTAVKYHATLNNLIKE